MFSRGRFDMFLNLFPQKATHDTSGRDAQTKSIMAHHAKLQLE